MKNAEDLFKWYFENYQKQSANKNRLDPADLESCLKEHDREFNEEATSGQTAVDIDSWFKSIFDRLDRINAGNLEHGKNALRTALYSFKEKLSRVVL